MAKLTEKQLISQLKELKEIKPRKEWAVLLKSQVLVDERKAVSIPAQKVSIMDVFSSAVFQRRLAYSFAAFVFVVVGLIGFARYIMPGNLFSVEQIAKQSGAASLTGQPTLKQKVATLNSKINSLAQIAKAGGKENLSSAINEIGSNASQLAKDIKDNPTDKTTINELATSLKTLADVPGADLAANLDVESLYQTVVQSQISDLQKATLTGGQKKTLSEAEDLYNHQKYTDALEEILLINSK